MKVNLVGKKAVNYISRKTNQQVTGVNLQVTYEDANTQGLAVESVYISSKHQDFDDIVQLPINVEIDISYNRFGGVDGVTVCK